MHCKGRTGRRRKRKKTCNEQKEFSHSDLGTDYIVLLKWAKKNGISFGKLRPATFSQTGRGLMTRKKLQSGDLLISVPESMLITTKTAQQSEIGKVLTKQCLETLTPLSANQLLCAFLLNEKYIGERSFWYPYIRTLPSSFNTPAYFTEEELNALPRSFQEQCIFQGRIVCESYEELKLVLDSCACELDEGFVEFCTLDEFKWAWFVVNSRSVYKPKNMDNASLNTSASRQEGSYALAPVLDLLNHSDKAEVQAGFSELSHKYEIHTLSAYNSYSQVFINYGPHGNRKLLLEYGFILPRNMHNTVKFSRELFYSIVAPNITGVSRKKKEVIRANYLDGDLCCSEESGLSWSVFVLLRILAMSEDEFREGWQKVLGAEPLSDQVELKVSHWGQSLIQCVLKSYGTKQEEGRDMVEGGSLSVNMQLALLLSTQEKQTLIRALELMESL